jgi:hypothetical protein
LQNIGDSFLFRVDQHAARDVFAIRSLEEEVAARIGACLARHLVHGTLHESGGNLDAALPNTDGNELRHWKLSTDMFDHVIH